MGLPRILHVGSGNERLPAWVPASVEVRLDIDPDCNPDIVASITDLGDLSDFDGIYCSHCLEHLYPHDIKTALCEFLRVLRPGGYAIVLVPDLEDVRATEEVVYMSAAGPITGLDMFYGLQACLPTMPHMAHHYGFTKPTLDRHFKESGFSTVEVKRITTHNLLGVGIK